LHAPETGEIIGPMESSLRDETSKSQSDAADQTSHALSPVRELTAHDLEEQRRLVRASLLLGIS
jgi:hypothetical protein